MIRTSTATYRLLLATALASAAPLAAQTNNISVGAAADTTLYEDATGSLANGGGASLFVGRTGNNNGGMRRRALLRFDLGSAVPPGAKILSARLQLFVAQASATQPIQATAHRVLQPWNEGSVAASGSGGAGAPAAAGESTWLHRDYPNVLWNNPGGDFATTPSFAFELPTSGTVLSDAQPGLIADVQDMVDNPSNNFGWLLKTDELQLGTARRIDSSEGSPLPPQLLISWVAAGNTGTFGLGTLTPTGHCAVGLQGPATGGTTVPATYAFLPPSSIGANFFALALDPIGVPLIPGTRVYLPPNFVPGAVFTTDAIGAASASIPVPAGFPGFLIVMQSAVLDSSPLGFALTNAAVMVTQ